MGVVSTTSPSLLLTHDGPRQGRCYVTKTARRQPWMQRAVPWKAEKWISVQLHVKIA